MLADVYALLSAAEQGPSEAQLDAAPAALLAFCQTPRLVEQLYPWGARRLLRPRMVRALVRALLASGALATDGAATDPADWSWVWSTAHATGPGKPPPQDVLDALTPPRRLDDDPPADEDDEAEGATAEPADETDLRTLLARRPAPTRPWPPDGQRPRTRAECVDAPRPCPWVSCRHHIALDVTDAGTLREVFEEVDQMPATCSLDLADLGPVTLDCAGRALGVSRERIRQIETKALAQIPRARLAQYQDGAPLRVRLPLLPLAPASHSPPVALPAASPAPEPAMHRPDLPDVSPANETSAAEDLPALSPVSLPAEAPAVAEAPVVGVPVAEAHVGEAPVGVTDALDLFAEGVLAWPVERLQWLAEHGQRREQASAAVAERERAILAKRHEIAVLEGEIAHWTTMRAGLDAEMRDALRAAVHAVPGRPVARPAATPPAPTAPPAPSSPNVSALLDGENPWTLRYRVLQAFLQRPTERLTCLDLHSLGPKQSLWATLSALVKDGKLERPETGFYRLPRRAA